jgi:hypothetical protein
VIDDWFLARKLGLVIEARVGRGRILICGSDLQTRLDERPAARQFRRSLLAYAASEQFDPPVKLTSAAILGLFSPGESTAHAVG